MINDVLSAVVSSSGLNDLILYEKGGKLFKTRSQINALIIQPFGTGKTISTLNLKNTIRLTEYTLPSIVGSIKKDGQFVQGIISSCGAKTLIIDEIQNIGLKAKNALLDLLENQQHQRGLGYNVPSDINKQGDNWSISVKGNMMDIRCQFSCICSGTYISNRSSIDKAWLSRFYPLFVEKDIDDIFKLIKGESKLNIKYHKFKGDRHFKRYLEFCDDFEKHIRSLPFLSSFNSENIGYIARTCLDTARLANYFSLIAGSTDIEKIHWLKALPFSTMQLRNYLMLKLTESDYEIFSNSAIKNHKELMAITGLSKSQVSRSLDKLIRLKLIVWNEEAINEEKEV